MAPSKEDTLPESTGAYEEDVGVVNRREISDEEENRGI